MSFTTVIFDFGGVITASPFEAFNRLEEKRGLPRDFVRRVNARDPDGNAWAKFERAEIDAATFDRAFADEARALGHELEGEAVLSVRSEEHTSELQSLMRISYSVFCLQKNNMSQRQALLLPT